MDRGQSRRGQARQTAPIEPRERAAREAARREERARRAQAGAQPRVRPARPAGVFDSQSPSKRLDPTWFVLAELAGGLIGAVVAILLLIALF